MFNRSFMLVRYLLCFAGLSVLASLEPAAAQSAVDTAVDGPSPAEIQLAYSDPTANPAMQAAEPEVTGDRPHLRSDQMPAIEEIGVTAPRFREDELIGPYAQPRWTATRIFPSTRVYVIPQGKKEVEYWYRPTFDDGDHKTRMLAEFEVGLPHRLQLDVYFRTDQAADNAELLYGQQIELRWAVADWGKIPGNPTFYFEWLNLEERPNKIEPKLLLGGDITEGWHWGVNVVAEIEYEGPEREHEYEFTSGIVHTIKDSVFSIGAAFKTSWIDVAGDRGNYERPAFIGPSFHWRPVPQWSINLETLVGFGSDSPDGQLTLQTGWEF